MFCRAPLVLQQSASVTALVWFSFEWASRSDYQRTQFWRFKPFLVGRLPGSVFAVWLQTPWLQATILLLIVVWTGDLALVCVSVPVKLFKHFLRFFGGKFQIIAA